MARQRCAARQIGPRAVPAGVFSATALVFQSARFAWRPAPPVGFAVQRAIPLTGWGKRGIRCAPGKALRDGQAVGQTMRGEAGAAAWGIRCANGVRSGACGVRLEPGSERGRRIAGQSWPQPPFSAWAAKRGGKGLRNIRLSHVARPVRALLPESARAATRRAREICNSNPSRAARPVRALLPERRLSVSRTCPRICRTLH